MLLAGLLLAGCGPAVHLEGEFVVYLQAPAPLPSTPSAPAWLPHGSTGRHPSFALLLDSGQERELLFSREPPIDPSARIEVWGDEVGEAVRVERYKILRGPPP